MQNYCIVLFSSELIIFWRERLKCGIFLLSVKSPETGDVGLTFARQCLLQVSLGYY